MGRSIEAFLYSRRNIVGCLLAIGGLALHFAGLVTTAIWLPIVVGLYLIGVLLVPGERGLDLALDANGSTADVRAGRNRLLAVIKGRVPDDIYARVTSIRDSIMVTLSTNGGGNGSGSSIADPNMYLIRQTALSYLPEALNSYMALPRLYATRSLGGRQSAHDLLLGQLNLMDRKKQEVADAFVQHDTDRLEAHGRFLAEKFASSSLQIDPEAATTQAGSAAPSGAAGGPNAADRSASSLTIPSDSTAVAPAPADAEVRERVR